MRAFLQRCGGFLAVQLAITALVAWSYARQYPGAQNFLAASIDKKSLLHTQATPRLILIGGSSMAFGVDSARVAAACGRRPVNMGLHGALGLKFMLHEAAPGVQRGDWIIIAPEYQQFSRLHGQSETLMNMVEIDPANARLLDSHQWAEAFDYGILQRFGKVTRTVLGRPGRFFREGTIAATRPYHRRIGFNENGDMVAHLTMKSPKMTEQPFKFRYRDERAQETIKLINRFTREAEAKGAKVFFSHPAIPEEVLALSGVDLERLEAELAAKLIPPRLDRVEELVFPIDQFFDTCYHLAAPGVERRTQLLAARMAEQARASVAR